jgi:hypothetical protein
MPVEKRFKIFKRTWKVAGLGGHKEKGIITITGSKFKDILRVMRVKGYARGHVVEEGIKYPHHSIRNLALIVSKETKTIHVEYESESALGQIVDDFNLSTY